MGTLIILEGGDGSGKATQSKLLVERLQAEGHSVMSVTFPDYDSDSSALVKMYLAGDFGKEPGDVNPFVASTFYAVDRFASFRIKWREFYEAGGIVVADRYTTSNMVHQMVKYDDKAERKAFLDWLERLEYDQFGLPRPDLVCLLDVPLAVTEALMKERLYKTGGQTGDIHEKDKAYLQRCHEAYDELVSRYGWQLIECTEDMHMRSIEAIQEDIWNVVKNTFKDNE